MRSVLVLGGAGYIGSHTCKRLFESGFAPVTFDNLSEGHAEFVKWGELIVGDIRNQTDLANALARVRPAAVIHFAAHGYVGESVVDPAKYYDNNTLGTLNVAQALRAAGGVPVIFSSTCATYGVPESRVICEQTAQRPINPYGHSKTMCEQILDDFSRAYGLRGVRLRYFNAAGADPDGEIGEAHRIETHLIPRAILAGLGQLDDFAVFGGDYATPDGSAVRDYVHVCDLAEAHVAACRYLLDGGASDVFNIGSGQGDSVFDIIEAVRAETGGMLPYRVEPRRQGDPPVLVADPGKAARVLGFRTRHSELKNIVQTAVAWHRQNWAPKASPQETLQEVQVV